MSDFDPYRDWLQIHDPQRPVNHYQLLGVALFESDSQVILDAADARMVLLKKYQTGSRGPLTQQVLNEIAAAKVCLLNPEKRAVHDREIRNRLNLGGPTAEEVPNSGTVGPPDLSGVSVSTRRTRSPRNRARRDSRQMTVTIIGVVVGGLMAVGAAVAVGYFGGFFDSGDSSNKVANSEKNSSSNSGNRNAKKNPDNNQSSQSNNLSTSNRDSSNSALANQAKSKNTDSNDTRLAWENSSYDGRFKKLADFSWAEYDGQSTQPKNRLFEKQRTPEFIELVDSRRRLGVRLFATKMQTKKFTDSHWRDEAGGKWIEGAKAIVENSNDLGNDASTPKVQGRFWMVYASSIKRIRTGDSFDFKSKTATIGKIKMDSLEVDGEEMPFGTRVVDIDLALSLVKSFCQNPEKRPIDNWFESRDILNRNRPGIDVSIVNLSIANMPRDDFDPFAVQPEDASNTSPRVRTKMPTPEEQRSAQVAIKQQYENEMKSRDPVVKYQLARSLIETALKTDDPATRYCLLQTSIATAAEIGKVTIVFDATDAVSTEFDVDKWAVVSDAFEQLEGNIKSPTSYHEFINLLPKYVRSAIREERFDSASTLVEHASKTARKAKSKTHAQVFARLGDDIKIMNSMFAESETARKSIEEGSDATPQSKMTMGRYLCFVQQDYAKGLKLLGECADSELATVASHELEGDESELLIADRWSRLADGLKKSEKFLAQQMRIHAAKIYRQEIAAKQGFERTQIGKKLYSIEQETHQAWPVVFAVDPIEILRRYEWTVLWSDGNHWKPMWITENGRARVKIGDRSFRSPQVTDSPAGVRIESSDGDSYALITLVGLELFATKHVMKDDTPIGIGHGGPTAERSDNNGDADEGLRQSNSN